jgi:hypothetical protein
MRPGQDADMVEAGAAAERFTPAVFIGVRDVGD